jgi:hypothetical protein
MTADDRETLRQRIRAEIVALKARVDAAPPAP